ncbi:MAG: hypothetical protein HYX47_23585 [Burkholderiales bacterium]|nr:hypothetical protein [Burkholderiales bacterium]
MPKPTAPEPFFTRFKGWVVGLTGVFVVLPALINGGHDVYSLLAKLPRTDAERVNERLTREYFRKTPIAIMPVPIKQNNGTVEVRFEIYERGDVFVEFGNVTQWFPFPARDGEKKTSGLSLISEAIAQAVRPSPQGMGRYTQSDELKDDAVVRERTYENGVVEAQVIDIRSGAILRSSSRATAQKPFPVAPNSPPVPKITPIDLDHFRTTKVGAPPQDDWRESLKAGLVWCGAKDNFLSRALCEYREKERLCGVDNRREQSAECRK